jgi:spore maturation protein SpmB
LEALIKIILDSGRSGIDLAFYVLLPVLVVMMAVMKVVEARGILARIANMLRPLLRLFGVPGAGAFAMLQLLFVSFAAPIATFSIMEKDGTTRRHIAATLAMVLTMSQANVVFPMAAMGLNIAAVFLSSIIGGLAAAALTYYIFTRSIEDEKVLHCQSNSSVHASKKSTTLNLMIVGGQEAVQVIFNAIPILILAIVLVNILKGVGLITVIQTILTPFLSVIDFPAVAVLPLITKYLAGGTAMMGVTSKLLQEGAITTVELNRMAGFLTNPCDIVGVAVLISAGTRFNSVVRPAVVGAAVGIIIRGILHLLWF